MGDFFVQGTQYEPHPLCDKCAVQDGKIHECQGTVIIDDYYVRVIHVTGHENISGYGKEGILYEGMASGLNRSLVEVVCHCRSCNGALFPAPPVSESRRQVPPEAYGSGLQ